MTWGLWEHCKSNSEHFSLKIWHLATQFYSIHDCPHTFQALDSWHYRWLTGNRPLDVCQWLAFDLAQQPVVRGHIDSLFSVQKLYDNTPLYCQRWGRLLQFTHKTHEVNHNSQCTGTHLHKKNRQRDTARETHSQRHRHRETQTKRHKSKAETVDILLHYKWHILDIF